MTCKSRYIPSRMCLCQWTSSWKSRQSQLSTWEVLVLLLNRLTAYHTLFRFWGRNVPWTSTQLLLGGMYYHSTSHIGLPQHLWEQVQKALLISFLLDLILRFPTLPLRVTLLPWLYRCVGKYVIRWKCAMSAVLTMYIPQRTIPRIILVLHCIL
jgi:hypothetical protein